LQVDKTPTAKLPPTAFYQLATMQHTDATWTRNDPAFDPRCFTDLIGIPI
jgi:hypothetical protein